MELKPNKKVFLPLIISCILLLTLTIFLATSCSSSKNKKMDSENPSLEKVKVQAGWLLNGEFANVCSAIINGYYEKEGLDVELVPGGPIGVSFIVATNALAQDESIDIAIDGDLVPLLRGKTQENEMKVKAFASFWNESPFGFIVRDDSGIENIKDLARKKDDGTNYKIGVTSDFSLQNAMANYLEVNVEDLDFVIVGSDASSFISGQVDALAAYWTTQAYEIEKAGIPYKFLNISELPGFNQPAMLALARENTIEEKEDVLVKWLRATQRGTKFVRENPEKAAEYILEPRCGGEEFDKNQELWLIERSISLFSETEEVGKLNKNQIENFAKAFFKSGQIPFVPETENYLNFDIFDLSKEE